MVDRLELFSIRNLKRDAADYLSELVTFFLNQGLPLQQLLVPAVDHLSVKAADSEDYEEYLSSIRHVRVSGSESLVNNRRLAIIRLSSPIRFGMLGSTYYLEVMEPRPEKVGNDLVGFEHIEIYYQPLSRIEQILRQSGVGYQTQDNPQHQTIVLKINPQGQEVKFTDTHLSDIEEKQLASGESKKI